MTTTCPCGGSGWRYVTDAYAEQLVPDPTPTGDTSPEAVAKYERQLADAQLLRAAARDSVYPCKDHNPTAFYRWAGGHLATDHDRYSCPECHDLAPKTRGPHTHATPPARRRPEPVAPAADPAEPIPEAPPDLGI